VVSNHGRKAIASDLPFVTVDRCRLVEVLQNLIDNAVNCTGSQAAPELRIGAVENETPTRDAEIRFFVKDNGEGLGETHHQRI
jgi:C4-dicarboxylate-specific signal transduction histidine kinase